MFGKIEENRKKTLNKVKLKKHLALRLGEQPCILTVPGYYHGWHDRNL